MSYNPSILESHFLDKDCWNPDINIRITEELFSEIKGKDKFDESDYYKEQANKYTECMKKRALYAPVLSGAGIIISIIIILIILFLFWIRYFKTGGAIIIFIAAIYALNYYFIGKTSQTSFYTICQGLKQYTDFEKFKGELIQREVANIQASAFREGQSGSASQGVFTGVGMGIGNIFANKAVSYFTPDKK